MAYSQNWSKEMKDLLKTFVLTNAKAIVAFVAAVVVQVFGVSLPEEVQVSIAALVVALVVWLVPNKG